MILKTIEYHEYLNDGRYWAIKPFELGRINLFTAKNATGKTRTLKAINWLSTIIKDNVFNDHANYSVEFIDDSEKYSYIINNDDKRVTSEKLIRNDKVLIHRESTGKGEIYAAQLGKNIEFQIPETVIAASRVDTLQYPFLDRLHNWAKSVRLYAFGSSMKQENGEKIDKEWGYTYENSENSVGVYYAGSHISNIKEKFINTVINSMNAIGYNLDEINVKQGLLSNSDIKNDDYTLFVKENGRNAKVTQNAMSQGMFRALSIIIHITYHAIAGKPTTILIDDIGEGLDFERSTKLIKILIELAEKNDNIQLIMSTNDRYVMNNVPLEYWQIIRRLGGECTVINYQNSKEKFEEFKYSGLNNFDLLATDYIDSIWKKI